jgi:hypothetical protein
MRVTLPAQLASAATRLDGSIKLVFETRELGADAAVLFAMARKEGWLLFASSEINEADIPDEKPDAMTGQKTAAQRLRSTLYVYWKQKGEQGDFENFYAVQMNRMIEQIKERLE